MEIQIVTKKHKQVVDITDVINNFLSKKKFLIGVCHVFVAHTTCAVTTMDLDPGTDEDFLDAITKMFPKGDYRHPHDPSHVGEHIMASLIGSSTTVPIKYGKFVLGTWQKVVLVELSGPRKRQLILEVTQGII